MVYVFKTNVKTKRAAKELKPRLDQLLANSKWNFDLEDCDKILRVESQEVSPKKIIAFMKKYNFECQELE